MTDHESTTDRVYAQLHASILSGELAAGSQHSVYRLADQLGVSRTPVREAVLRLADAGMMTVERNRGVTIRGTSLQDIREIFEFRLMIEVPAASYAALHGGDALTARLRGELAAMHSAAEAQDEPTFMTHDRILHEAIMEVLGNPRLSAALDKLRDATKLRSATTIGPERTLADLDREHEPIIAAIERRDPVAAAEAMEEHLVRTGTLHQERVMGGASTLSWHRRVRDHVRVGGVAD